MIVDCAVYRGGQRQEVAGELGAALSHARSDDERTFVWIGLYAPSQSELSDVAGELGLHPLAVEDAVHAHQRPKLEHYGDSVFVVLKTLRYIERTSDIETGEIMIFLGSGFVVTVRHGEGNPLGGVRQRLEHDRWLLRYGPGAVLYAICDQVVDTYEAIVAEIDQDVEEVERSVFSPARTNDAEVIYALKREVIEFRRAVLPLREPARTLASGRLPLLHDESRTFFRDVADHVERVGEQVEAHDDLLTSVLNANLTRVNVQQNEDMRRISAWVAILAAPTLVASIYGMNFDFVPASTWHYGYFAVLALMVIVCLALYRAFRKSGWL